MTRWTLAAVAICLLPGTAAAQLLGADGSASLYEIDPGDGSVLGEFVELEEGNTFYIEAAPDGRLFGASDFGIWEIDPRTGAMEFGPCLCDNALIATDFAFAPDGTGYGFALGTIGASYVFTFDPGGGESESLYLVPDDIDNEIGPLAWLEGTGLVSIGRTTHEIYHIAGDEQIEVIGSVEGLEGDAVATAYDGETWLVSTGSDGLYSVDLETGESELIGEMDAPGTFSGLAVLAGCPADFNGDGELDVLDFVAFQAAWHAMEPAADRNGDGAFGVLDFVCFQGVFVEGCE